MNRFRTALGHDGLNPTTLFNPFGGVYYGTWKEGVWRKIRAAFCLTVWRAWFKNLRYELIDRPRYKKCCSRKGEQMIKHYTYEVPLEDAKEAALGFLGFINEIYKQGGNVMIIKNLLITNSPDVDEEGNPIECAIRFEVAVDKISP